MYLKIINSLQFNISILMKSNYFLNQQKNVARREALFYIFANA